MSESEEETWHNDPQLHLNATTRPGAKVPHVWLVDQAGTRVSTLDVLHDGKFTLLTGLSGTAWQHAIEKLQLPYLGIVVTGSPGANDLYCDWQKVREVHEAGAILVRPDGHVAWRCVDPVWQDRDAVSMLKGVVEDLLHPGDISTYCRTK